MIDRRYRAILEEKLPQVDMDDMNEHRQFAPEYASAAYKTMLAEEYAIGNYVEGDGCSLNITNSQRRKMVSLIQGLHKHKGWRLETLFLAVSIADRFLKHRAK